MITIANGVDRKFYAKMISFVGILSVSDTFLVSKDFRVKFTSLEVTGRVEGKLLLKLK